jgi:hypothetical protein
VVTQGCFHFFLNEESKLKIIHIIFFPYHHGMARPQVADGGDGLQVWRAAANILNKKSRTADEGGPSAWVLGVGLTTHRKRKAC